MRNASFSFWLVAAFSILLQGCGDAFSNKNSSESLDQSEILQKQSLIQTGIHSNLACSTQSDCLVLTYQWDANQLQKGCELPQQYWITSKNNENLSQLQTNINELGKLSLDYNIQMNARGWYSTCLGLVAPRASCTNNVCTNFLTPN